MAGAGTVLHLLGGASPARAHDHGSPQMASACSRGEFLAQRQCRGGARSQAYGEGNMARVGAGWGQRTGQADQATMEITGPRPAPKGRAKLCQAGSDLLDSVRRSEVGPAHIRDPHRLNDLHVTSTFTFPGPWRFPKPQVAPWSPPCHTSDFSLQDRGGVSPAPRVLPLELTHPSPGPPPSYEEATRGDA